MIATLRLHQKQNGKCIKCMLRDVVEMREEESSL